MPNNPQNDLKEIKQEMVMSVLKLEKPNSGLQTFPPCDLSPAAGFIQYVLERLPDAEQLTELWLYKDYGRYSLVKHGWACPGFPVNTSSSCTRARKKRFKCEGYK